MEERKVSWLELFYDLIFVVAISSTTHLLLEIEKEPQRMFLIMGEYLLMVVPLWWAWAGETMFLNRYGLIIKKPALFMFVQMLFMLLMTASFNLNFDATYPTFLIGYIGIRFSTILQYYSVQRCLEDEKSRKVVKLLRNYFTMTILISSSSIFFDGSLRYFILFLGMFLDIVIPLFNHNRLNSAPVDVAHLAERLGLFTLITFGETVVALIGILTGKTNHIETLLYVGLSFLVIILIWWSYYDQMDDVIDKEQETNGQLLLYSNLFLLLAVTFFAAALHLGAQQHVQPKVLVHLFFMSFFLFYSVKHFIFNRHRKGEIERKMIKRILLLGSLIIGMYLLALIVHPSVLIILICLAVLSLLDNQLRYQF